ncbi:MAG: LPS assembly protein LptD [Alphaproteobacteria bacterium]|jgi:LPS-assembly protein|nr:LPS assembly protein LptD [Alphaproteobacteria bacterium]
MLRYFFIFVFILLNLNPLQAKKEEPIPAEEFKKNINSISKVNYKKDDVNFSAQNIEYNFKDETVVATGLVTLVSADNIITADTLFYSIKDDILYVKGNVVFTNKYDNKIYSEEAILDPKLNTGLIEQFKIFFRDGSTLKARSVSKTNESTYTLKCMSFTACSIAENYTPTWQLNARKAIYNQEQGNIDLYNVWFQVKGIPVLWTPYFSFSNLDFLRKAGFLTPSYENNSIYGKSVIVPFYIPLGDHQDITLNAQLFLTSNPVYFLDYNGKLENGSFNSSFSFVNSQYDKAEIDKNKRWHAFFDLQKNLTDTWRTSMKIEETSDNDYLNMYNINIKDSKESFYFNKIRFEGFFNHNSYFDTYMAKYRTINPDFMIENAGITNDLDNTFSMSYSYLSEYSPLGRVNFFFNAANLFTKSFDNLTRLVGNLTYKYYKPTNYGNYSFDSLLQGVGYSDAMSTEKFVEDTTASSIAVAATIEYPTLFASDSFVYSVSPIAQISYSKNLDKNKNSFLIDSYNVNVNSSSMFDLNHFQGYDQFDESKDLKYAFKLSLLNNTNQGSRIFIGQMFKVGLDDSLTVNNRIASNYFVSAYFYPLQNLSFNYDGIVDKNFKQVETSLGAGYNNNLFSLRGSFDEYTQLDTNLFGVNRISELSVIGALNIHKNIKMSSNATYDVSTAYELSLKSVNFNLTWVNECVEILFYNNKDYLSPTKANSWGFRVNIKSIDNYMIPM